MNERDILLLEEILELKRRQHLLSGGEEEASEEPTDDEFRPSRKPTEVIEETVLKETFPDGISTTEEPKEAVPERKSYSRKEQRVSYGVSPEKEIQRERDSSSPFTPRQPSDITRKVSSSYKRLKISLTESYQEDQEKKLRFDSDETEETPKTAPVAMNMRFEFASCPQVCEKFLNVENFSQLFVDDITHDAITKGRGFQQRSGVRYVEGIEYVESTESLSDSISTYVCVFEWPTIEDFTVEIGTAKLEEFISYWKFTEDWKHCINFLYGESDSACDFYNYEAIFGIPCKQYPIAQATASVFFTFELSRIRPRDCLVDMYYCFEGQRQKHQPGNFTFQENRLFNIVDAKIKFFKTLTF